MKERWISLLCCLALAVSLLPARCAASREVDLPVVMYHHISPKPKLWGDYVISPEQFEREGIDLYGYPLMQDGTELARHDPKLLAAAIMDVFGKKVVRKGIYGAYDTMVRDR